MSIGGVNGSPNLLRQVNRSVYLEIVEAARITIISEEGGVVILCLIKNVADLRKSPPSSTKQINQYFGYAYNLPLQNSKEFRCKSLAGSE